MSDLNAQPMNFVLGECYQIPDQYNSLEIQNIDVDSGTLDLYMVNSQDLAGFQIILGLQKKSFHKKFMHKKNLNYFQKN